MLALLAIAVIGSCSDSSPPTLPPLREPRSVLVSPDGKGDFATIQQAIDNAIDGDTINLANGRFRGTGNRDLNMRGRRMILRSLSSKPVFCLIDCEGTDVEPHRGVVFLSGESNETIVEAITITNAYSIPGGSAVLCENGSSPTLRFVTFETNANIAVACNGGSALFDHCTFQSNNDGAITCSGTSSVSLTACTFLNNYKNGSGAAVTVLSSTIEVSDCEFLGNAAGFSGGAIYANGSPARATVELSDCLFSQNVGSYHGGALHLDATDFTIERTTFVGNAAGVNGGAAWLYAESRGNIAHCLFYGNEANKGAAINCGWGAPDIANTIIAFNIGSMPVLCDTISGSAIPTLACTDIFGNSDGNWMGCILDQVDAHNNFSLDPLFCDPSTGDLRLSPASPCGPDGVCGLVGASDIGCTTVLSIERPTAKP